MTSLVLAQAPTAQITGRVTDQSGAIIVDARVTVAGVDTGVKRETVSNEQGNYTIPLLDPGNYQISATKEGFRAISRSAIQLHVGQVVRLDFAMEVGSVTETVQITAEAPLVDSERSSLGGVIANRQIRDLPLSNRNTVGLALLVAGVRPGPQTGGDNGRNPANLWINGGRGNSSDILADGISLTTPEFNPSLTLPLVPQVDVIEEFKVHTNSLSAEFGRSGGGILDFVYKSGTNSLHGTLFEFYRNNKMDAMDFFDNQRGVKRLGQTRHQFGGTLGGPVVIPGLLHGRDRLFFFASYEGYRQTDAQTPSATVPSLLERAGDFSETRRLSGGVCQPIRLYDPYSTTANPSGGFIRTQYPNNRIPASQIDPVAARIVTFYPTPNAPGDPCTGQVNFTASGQSTNRTDLPSGRVDWLPSPKDRLFIRISGRRALNNGFDYWGTRGRPNNPKPNIEASGDNAAASYVRTINPTTIGEFRFGLARYRSISAGSAAGEDPEGSDFDMKSALGYVGATGNFIDQMNKPLAFPRISPSGYTAMGTGQQAFNDGGGTSYQFAGSVTTIRGGHTIKAGTDLRTLQDSGPNAFFASGSYTFTPAFTQGPNPTSAGTLVGNGMASLLLGYGTGLNQVQINPRLFVSNHYYALYFQDDWRVTKRLTLNLGLRYDVEDGRSERFNQLSWFDFTAPSPLAGLVPGLPNIRGGLKFVGVDGSSKQFDTDKNNFGPRAGLAYSINSNTVARVAYGILYEPFIGRSASSGAGYTGFGAITTWVSTLDGVTPYRPISNPFPTGLTPPPGSSKGLMTQVGENLGSDGSSGRDGAFDRTSVVGYVQQWNVSVQRGLPFNMTLDLGYTGSKGTKLADGGGFQENQPDASIQALGNQLQQTVANPFFGILDRGPLSLPTTTRGQLLRPFPHFTNLLNFRPTAASSIYHAFQLQLTKRFSHGVQFQVAYTNGKAIDDSSNAVDFRGDLGGSGRHQDYYNRRSSRSVSLNDIAQRLVLSYVWDLPFGRGRQLGTNWNRVIDGILGGWQFNGISTFQSGKPLIIENQSNNAFGTLQYSDLQRPNVSGDPYLSPDRPTQDKLALWFDRTKFSQPAAFTFGNAPRVLPNVRADGMNTHDFSIFKNFSVTEGSRIQVRGEFFNAFNSPQFGLPGQSFGSTGFGVVTSTQNDPRIVQLGFKYIF